MARRFRRRSVRLWQTELFIIVTVVAILILSVSLSQGLQRTLVDLGERDQLSDATALSTQLGSEFPLTVESRRRIQEVVDRYRVIYGDDVWVFDVDGTVIDSAYEESLEEAVLTEARLQGLADSPPYSSMDLSPDGSAVAGKAIYDSDDRRAGVVVTASSVADSLAVLDAVRGRLWTTFWVALVVAGLLGLAFAEFIGRRVRQMTKAAAAIADGDFGQRLPTSLVPDEIQELAESYNRMAATLGETFSVLREREREIAAVVESMGEGVVAFDRDGAVRVINPEATLLFERAETGEEALDIHVAELTDSEPVRELVVEGLSGSNVSGTTELGERTVLLHVTPIITAEQSLEGAVLIMSDVTERQRLEEAQRRFVANASHEMRTPIAALKGLLELLTGGAAEKPETRDDFLRTMSLEADRLGRLVADLLTLAQLEAGDLLLRQERVLVVELLENVTTVIRPLAENSGQTIDIYLSDTELAVSCDRDRITQVLLGFVDNALRHTPADGHITLGAHEHDGFVVLDVSDDGPGIDPEMIPRLFDRFFRADESRGTTKGTGLGLSIAKEILDAHDAEVRVESQVGQGTTFSFDLPIAK
jgi:two-component system sensor histidine kinase VicK